MTPPEDPPRWSEGAHAPAALESLLSTARRDAATDAELAELSTRLEPILQPSPRASSAAAVSKLALGGVIAILGLGAAIALRYARPAARPAASAPAAATAPVAVASTRALEPTPVLELPSVAMSGAPVIVGSAPDRVPAAVAKKSTLGSASPGSHSSNTTQAEASLLEQARSALGADPARALSLTQQHAQQFPRGLLVQEREVIAISALRRLGRNSEAEARAARFDARYPHSAHQQTVDRPSTK